MAFDQELFKALRAGLARASSSELEALNLIWSHPKVPVLVLPTMASGKEGGGVWLQIGNSLGKQKLWPLMPARIRREFLAQRDPPFYSGLLVQLDTVVDSKGHPYTCFDLLPETERALHEMHALSRRRTPSKSFRRIDEIEDDPEPVPQGAPAETERIRRSIVVRRGQPVFRRDLLSAYGGKCAVTGCTESSVLEAAHIVGFSTRGRYEVSNGLLLRADWHTLFDLGYWAVSPDTLKIELSPAVLSKEYRRFHGRDLGVPLDPKLAPAPKALKSRYRAFKRHMAR